MGILKDPGKENITVARAKDGLILDYYVWGSVWFESGIPGQGSFSPVISKVESKCGEDMQTA